MPQLWQHHPWKKCTGIFFGACSGCTPGEGDASWVFIVPGRGACCKYVAFAVAPAALSREMQQVLRSTRSICSRSLPFDSIPNPYIQLLCFLPIYSGRTHHHHQLWLHRQEQGNTTTDPTPLRGTFLPSVGVPTLDTAVVSTSTTIGFLRQ